MDPADLEALRERALLTQAGMAKGLGIGTRTYQNLENGDKTIGRRHVLMIERFALQHAIEMNDPMLAPASVRNDAVKLAAALTGS